MRRLVIGLGNADRGDDAVGIAVCRVVAVIAPAAMDIEVIEADDVVGLLDLWTPDDDVVLVDAMASDRAVGSVVRIDTRHDVLPSHGWAAGGTHALGLGAAVELARALDRLPANLVVVGVEIGSAAATTALSPAVASAVEPAARVVLTELGDGRQ